MGWDDLRAALAVVVLVFLSTCPVLVPFLVVPEPRRALHLSNGVAIVMLFGMGAALGRLTSGRWLRAGLAMVAIGSALVALTMALGG
jgi:VIT1/CCC1 family predicted Fe2+/Mn2+ transporter